jgi:RNA polymerase sigma-70 factor (ECF subfamily)
MTEPSDWDWERYRKLLKLVLRMTQLDPRLRRRFDSSDLVQEALLKAIKAKDQCRGPSDGERIAWLKQILKNVAHDLLDREIAGKRDPDREQSIQALAAKSSFRLDAMLPDDKQSSPSERLMREEELVRLAEAMDDMSDEWQDVILLRCFHDLSVKEVATRLDKSDKAVAGLYLRGIHRLRKRLADLREGQGS